MTDRRYLFVGERPSPTAYKNGWTWHSGRLAARSLFDALEACGVEPHKCGFVNAFCDSPYFEPTQKEVTARVSCLRAAADAGAKIVALGLKVSRLLYANGVPHVTMRHPAARGAGRKRAAYANHVKNVLEIA